jgi:hypothetical protein
VHGNEVWGGPPSRNPPTAMSAKKSHPLAKNARRTGHPLLCVAKAWASPLKTRIDNASTASLRLDLEEENNMAEFKLIQTVKPWRVASGEDVGIALQMSYELVEPVEAGYDLFDEEQLNRVRTSFMPMNESRFTLTVSPHPIKHYYRVFAKSK